MESPTEKKVSCTSQSRLAVMHKKFQQSLNLSGTACMRRQHHCGDLLGLAAIWAEHPRAAALYKGQGAPVCVKQGAIRCFDKFGWLLALIPQPPPRARPHPPCSQSPSLPSPSLPTATLSILPPPPDGPALLARPTRPSQADTGQAQHTKYITR